MRAPFKINGQEIVAGSNALVRIPLPGLHSETSVHMPVHVFHGKRDGPVLFISAALHGDEINGVEVIRRILSMPVIKRLKGTLLAIPIVNVFGFDSHLRYLPDRRDLNRFFPGREQGSLAARVANIFMSEIVERSTIGIDLHTAAIHRDNLPQIRADLKDEHLNGLARSFKAPVLLHSAAPEGSLRHAAGIESVPVMVYEAGEALRFDEVAIRVAVRGILNVMKELGMLPKRTVKSSKASVILRSSVWERAPMSGILRAQVKLGDMVHKGDILGFISEPADQKDKVVEASSNGIIIGRTNIPLIYEGDALFHIGRSSQTTLLEAQIGALQDEDALSTPELIEEPIIV
ncbi:MAG: succinylglutamate desuccinylase/aspartoacylase family protein [Gammaproteobacteria bacterium]|nr:succinylglutamate desuccinylase/aspartoacylase family protein [Gammaproteobacteria bacterium]